MTNPIVSQTTKSQKILRKLLNAVWLGLDGTVVFLGLAVLAERFGFQFTRQVLMCAAICAFHIPLFAIGAYCLERRFPHR